VISRIRASAEAVTAQIPDRFLIGVNDWLRRRQVEGSASQEAQRGRAATEQEKQTEKWRIRKWDSALFFCPTFFCQHLFR
jgi:hypothetical protein